MQYRKLITQNFASSAVLTGLAALFIIGCGTPQAMTSLGVSAFESTAVPSTTTTPEATRAASSTVTTTGGIQVLRIGEDIYPDVIDPQKSSFVNEFEILNLAYEGLLSVDNKGNVQPASAESWEKSKDGTQMTFHIRDGLKRSDGTPITAKDFEYALQRAVDPRVPGKQYVSLMFDVKGAKELAALDPSKVSASDIQTAIDNLGVKATDDQTLVVTFSEPTGFWEYVAAQPITFPTDKRAVDKDPDNWWMKPENHVGNGPFIIKSMDPGNKITLVANPNYWNGKPNLDRVEISYNADNAATLDAYIKGDLDIDAAVVAEEVPTITASTTLTSELHMYPAATTVALAFNNSLPPFNDKNVRTAFSQALDRGAFVKDQLGGVGKPYTRWIPAGVPGAQADEPGVPDTDASAAVNTLVNNGYAAADSTADKPKVNCDKLGAIKFTYPDSPINKARVEYISANLQKVIGCPITPDPVQGTEFTSLTKDVTTNPQLSLQRWVEDYPHPQNWLSAYWACGAFSRRYGYCNLLMDQVLKVADSTTDIDQAVKLYGLAEDMLINDVPGAFFFNPDNLSLVKPYVIGPDTHLSSRDAGWPGQWGPVSEYSVDLKQVPASYPKQ